MIELARPSRCDGNLSSDLVLRKLKWLITPWIIQGVSFHVFPRDTKMYHVFKPIDESFRSESQV